MSNVAISVENISKRYSIGDTSSGSLQDAFRSLVGRRGAQKTEEFWALKDISFEVKQGEAIGIIGRIEIDGRVSS